MVVGPLAGEGSADGQDRFVAVAVEGGNVVAVGAVDAAGGVASFFSIRSA